MEEIIKVEGVYKAYGKHQRSAGGAALRPS